MVPNADHGMGGAYGRRKMNDFFVRHLLGAESTARDVDASATGARPDDEPKEMPRPGLP